MTQLSSQGRATLSTKANEQKANGTKGQFGHRNAAVDSSANGALNGPGNPRDTEAMQQVFASEPEAVGQAYYDAELDVASIDAENVFGVRARVCYNYGTNEYMATIHHPRVEQVFGPQAEAFMEGLTTGVDGVERTATEAFERFRNLATQAKKPVAKKTSAKKAATPEPAEPAEKPRVVEFTENQRLYLGEENAKAIESGKIPLGSDPRIANGEIFDTVYDEEDGILWHRAELGKSYPIDDVYGMRIQTSRTLTEDEQMHLGGLIGYAWATGGRGEGCSSPVPGATANVFHIGADSTKSRGDAPGKVVEMLETYLAEGSPQRKTKGMSRLVEAFPDQNVRVDVYFDSRVS